MSKLQLPSVTLLIADCVNVNGAINVIEHCKSMCDFGAVKLLTHIPTEYPAKVKIKPLNTLIAYSIFMLTKCPDYIDTDHVLIVQRDGFILNPQSWNSEWLNYDYIAPLYVQYPKVGSGGFSLRTKKLMKAVQETVPEWDWTQKKADEIQEGLGYYEDGVTSLTYFNGRFKFATPEEACKFSQGGNPDPKYYYPYPFGYHGFWANIDHATGLVSPVCEHKEGYCPCVKPHLDHIYKMSK
jgi:hypothetical protein